MLDALVSRCRKLAGNLPSYWQVFGMKGLLSFAAIRYSSSQSARPLYFRASKHPLWVRPGSTDVPTMRDIFFNREYDFQIPGEVKVIIDAGANIGVSSVFFAKTFPDARIIAIEPEAANFMLLQRNVARYPHVTPVHAALWNTSGHLRLVDPGRGEHGFTTQEDAGAQAEAMVACISIPDLLNAYGLDHVDILKMDIEGSEKEVFESASPWIDRVSVVIVELHERFKPGCLQSFYEATSRMQTIGERGKIIVRLNAQAPGIGAAV
jgi:FkbM family methyltransferase